MEEKAVWVVCLASVGVSDRIALLGDVGYISGSARFGPTTATSDVDTAIGGVFGDRCGEDTGYHGAYR